MQIVIRGVTGSTFTTISLSFTGPSLPYPPAWGMYNNTVPGGKGYFESVFDWGDPTKTPTGWTFFTNTGGRLLPSPVEPPPALLDVAGVSRLGYVETGYVIRNAQDFLHNLDRYADFEGESLDPETGLTNRVFAVKSDTPEYKYADLIMSATHLIYTEPSDESGYGGVSIVSAGFVDIIDGSTTITIDLSEAMFLPEESAAQNNRARGHGIPGHSTIKFSIHYIPMPKAAKDIFWTRRTLCEELT